MKKNTHILQEELEKKIIRGLAYEWYHTVEHYLPNQFQKQIRLPIFSISDLQNKWGYWSKEKRLITINRNLVLNYPWDTIREVLRHEIAHQFTDEVLHSVEPRPHGRDFHFACDLLRANPNASDQFVPLHDLLKHDHSHAINSNDTMLMRIQKLMALAGSSNIHEAESAMAKAHELIKKYNIEIMDQGIIRQYCSIFLEKPGLRHPKERNPLAILLEEFYFVVCMWTPAYVIEKEKMGKALEISGTLSNIKIASYVYDFINHFIDMKWNEYNKEKRLNRYRKSDFACGIIRGFRSKLTQQQQMQKESNPFNPSHKYNTCKDVMNFVQKEMKTYISHRYPRIASRRRHYYSDQSVIEDGKAIGEQLIISKGIEEKSNPSKISLIS
ncbi:MAG: DUF2786 domain-containing protein [Desulfobacterales bacterium]|nr:DUF2786 domain-containing protein [Desulfobacterales bacterium]